MTIRLSQFKTVHALVFAGLLGLMTSSAVAQSSGYDANCDPRNYTADEMLRQELCSAHLGCRLTMKAATSVCKVKDFFSSLGGVMGGRSTPDNLDVLEALNRTEVPQTAGVKQTNASARPYYEGSRLPSYDRSNAAQISVDPAAQGGQPSGMLSREKDGRVRWFEGTGARNATNQLSGNGVQIDSRGLIKAGIVIDDAIGGGGIERAADGSWSAGTFKGGQLDGAGYQLKSDGKGTAPVLEGTFRNNQPDGVMLATWPDFSSRKELWKDGKLIVVGPKVARGQIPSEPKTPEQIATEKAAAEKARFESDLAQLANPAAIYAFADEWSSKGDMDKARAAWRSLMTRYPDSPFALRAADRLGGGGAAPASASNAPGQTYTEAVDFSGIWVGESSGNRVEVDFQPDGIYVVAAGTRTPGQAAGTFLFKVQSPGVYAYTFPGGQQAIVRMEGPDRMRINNPDGSTELFVKGGSRSSPARSAACTGSPAEALDTYNREFTAFQQAYPLNRNWGTRDIYKYSMFAGEKGLQLLERQKACLSPQDYSANQAALAGAVAAGRNGCRATSSDGGAGCVAEYPR